MPVGDASVNISARSTGLFSGSHLANVELTPHVFVLPDGQTFVAMLPLRTRQVGVK